MKYAARLHVHALHAVLQILQYFRFEWVFKADAHENGIVLRIQNDEQTKTDVDSKKKKTTKSKTR